MEKSTKSSKSNSFYRWMRIIHRDLGFFMVGISLIYGISGILLNHMGEEDPSYKSEEHTMILKTDLGREELKIEWNRSEGVPVLKNILAIDEDHYKLMLQNGMGVYSRCTGEIDYEIHKRKAIAYWINRLHYNKIAGWSFMGDFFAISLIFFALSGIVMVRGKRGIAGRGKWYLLAGAIIPLLYILL